MGLFKTNKLLDASPSMIPQISEAIETEFRKDGYEVTAQKLMYGGKEISITKGGLFKAILGLKTALKIKLVPQEGRIAFGAGVGIFGNGTQRYIDNLVLSVGSCTAGFTTAFSVAGKYVTLVFQVDKGPVVPVAPKYYMASASSVSTVGTAFCGEFIPV
mgnify:CR=1 FL=1